MVVVWKIGCMRKEGSRSLPPICVFCSRAGTKLAGLGSRVCSPEGGRRARQPAVDKQRWKRSITQLWNPPVSFHFPLPARESRATKAKRLSGRLQAISRATTPNNVDVNTDYGLRPCGLERRSSTWDRSHGRSAKTAKPRSGATALGDRHGLGGTEKELGWTPPTFLSTIDYRLQRCSSLQTRAAAQPRSARCGGQLCQVAAAHRMSDAP